MQNLSISVVIPVYSGANYLEELVDELSALRELWSEDNGRLSLTEVIFVDDEAIDHSSEILGSLASQKPWISVLHLGRNFGQHAATVAGILHTSGDWVITMDEDLQHSPSSIPLLLRQVAISRCDIVYAQPTDNVHENFVRDFSSRAYKWLIEVISSNPQIRYANSFRLIRGGVARGASSVCGHDTYFDVALTWFTSRIEVAPMNLKDRRFIRNASTGYSLRKLLSHARKMMVSSNLKVLRMGAVFGFVVTIISMLGIIGLVVMKVLNPDIISIQGWTSLILAISTFGGLSLMFLGIVLEYLSLLVQRAHGRPLFFALDRSSDSVLLEYFADSIK